MSLTTRLSAVAVLDGFSYRSLLMAQLQALEVDHLVVVVHY
jgi:hypothetical protein